MERIEGLLIERDSRVSLVLCRWGWWRNRLCGANQINMDFHLLALSAYRDYWGWWRRRWRWWRRSFLLNWNIRNINEFNVIGFKQRTISISNACEDSTTYMGTPPICPRDQHQTTIHLQLLQFVQYTPLQPGSSHYLQPPTIAR